MNITAADIVRPGFASQFLRMVEESGFDRRRLTVEVTEGGLIEDLNAAAYLLARLRQDDWQLEFGEWATEPTLGIELPNRIEAERGAARVRLVVDAWTTGAP